LVQKHKVVALRGNGTLRADPRVSSSAEDVARSFFSLLFHHKHKIAFPRFFRTCAKIVKRTRRKRFEFDRRCDVRIAAEGKGRTWARRTAFAVVRKEQPNAFNAYYQSSIHKRATRFAASLKKVKSSLAKNYYAVDHEKRDERTMGSGGYRQEGHEWCTIPILREWGQNNHERKI